jgi:hypothetical protein
VEAWSSSFPDQKDLDITLFGGRKQQVTSLPRQRWKVG